MQFLHCISGHVLALSHLHFLPSFFSLQISDFIVEQIQLFAFIKVRISQDLKGLLFQYYFFPWLQTDIKGRHILWKVCQNYCTKPIHSQTTSSCVGGGLMKPACEWNSVTRARRSVHLAKDFVSLSPSDVSGLLYERGVTNTVAASLTDGESCGMYSSAGLAGEEQH